MKADEFDYDLPKELIAYYPKDKRDSSRLLVVNKRSREIIHRNFSDITDYLVPGDLLVLNNTKVIPARLTGRRDGRETDLLLTERISSNEWKVLITKPKIGLVINFNTGLSGTLRMYSSNEWGIVFNSDADEFIRDFGSMPLPPYIERESEEIDKSTYQTVYAKKDGAIAAPTAGLHFTDNLLEQIRNCCIDIKFITLHVGIGTFRPVKTENISDPFFLFLKI